MAAVAFYFPVPGTVVGPDYELSFFLAGTSTPAAVFSDSNLQNAIAQPIVMNADGVPDTAIFLDPDNALKVVLETDLGVAVSGYPFDGMAVPSTAN